MLRSPLLGLGSSLLLALACAPDTQAPVAVMALVANSDRTFEAAPVELTTVTDIAKLEGTTIRMLGGSKIIYDPNDPQLQINGGALTSEQLRRALVKEDGNAPNASYVDNGDILWPADFDTWNLVTTYYNFERALDYFESMGLPRETLEGQTVYYFPEFVLKSESSKPLTDNALFFAPIKGFAVLPFDELQGIPFGMNPGIIGHEFGHHVFNERVFGGGPGPDQLLTWSNGGSGPEYQLNLLNALEEGLADYHAHGLTCQLTSGCDPRFVEGSVPERIADERDLSNTGRCMTFGIETTLTTADRKTFDQANLRYIVGTLFSTALYQAGAANGKQDALQRYVLKSYTALGEHFAGNLNSPINVSLASVANVIAGAVEDADLKTRVCNEFIDHLQIPGNAMPNCPVAASGGGTCPSIR